MKVWFPISANVKGKPIRYGYKIWCLCDDKGYLFNFSVYTGRSQRPTEPLGTNVVNNMISTIDSPSSYRLYFDNFFTSVPLLVNLRDKGFRATGTIRENRSLKAPLSTKSIMKKKKRGYYETCFSAEKNVCIVKWLDSAPVMIASNFEGPEPESSCTRYSVKDKKRIKVKSSY